MNPLTLIYQALGDLVRWLVDSAEMLLFMVLFSTIVAGGLLGLLGAISAAARLH